ncbi:LuxR family transcriptional regulator [Deinococcus aerolatus]|uniref:LuxR family transcriptional regulator n=2 Tax=Deinococcus aerolatus TaxID=522487 RepID=A0ABQ2GE60_9DEIO|nr:LuxR family transcriptional regulator [Deinococcus aerolatus]
MDPGDFAFPELVGRDHELAVARELLTRPDIRVVNIRGAGGVGKTRLAQALLADIFPNSDLGGCFVDLVPQRGEGQLLPAIMRALHLPASPDPALDQLAAAIGHRSILLVLDNLEHLPGPEADLAALTSRLPGARLLITSRRVLHLRGVQELPLRPLAVPVNDAHASASPAVQLFVQRAQEVAPDFALSADNAAVLSAICRVLEGLPLALELAAARLRAVDLEGLLGWLNAPLEVLTDGPLDDAPHRQSLRSAVRWSADLLSPTEREVFLACGAFLGGFTLQALEAVAGVDGTQSVLIALVEHSLVQRAAGPEPRWRLLEPVREYAAGEGRSSGRSGRLADRHAHFFLSMAEHIASGGVNLTPEGMARLQADDANLHAALEYLVAAGLAGEAQRFVLALTGYWASQGGLSRAVALCARVLALPGDVLSARRAEVFQSSAWLALRNHQHREAVRWGREGLEVWRALGDPAGEASALSTLADVLGSQGQAAPAIKYFQQALGLAEAQHDLPLQAQTQHNLGFTLGQAGDYEAALAHLKRALDLYQTLGYIMGEAYSSVACARMSALLGDLDAGLTHLRRGWRVGQTLRDVFFEESLLYTAALLSQRRGHLTLAVRLSAASTAVQRRSGVRMPPSCEVERGELIDALRAALPTGDFTAAWEVGMHAGPEVVAAELNEAVMADGPGLPTAHHLTPREQQVLIQVAEGHSDKKIAQALGISPGTVGKHVASLLGKLEVHNRVELTRWAIGHGLAEGGQSKPPRS